MIAKLKFFFLFLFIVCITSHAYTASYSEGLKYEHLWGWLAGLCKAIEWSLVNIHQYIISNWGWAIVIFAILLKILLLPIGIITMRLQAKTHYYQSILAPQISEIKSKYD